MWWDSLFAQYSHVSCHAVLVSLKSFPHRRIKDVQDRPAALQADFCFINLVTGTFAKDQPTAFQYEGAGHD